jgi:hypothetical protein
MKNVYLKPIFSSDDIGKDLIFINCTLGYNGNINLLFADKTYDYLESKYLKDIFPGFFRTEKDNGLSFKIVNHFKIFPKNPQNYKLYILEENKFLELNNKNINYTHGLQIDSDKYLLVCHSKEDASDNTIKKNCEIYNPNGKLLKKLDFGSKINNIQIINNHEIWVSYYDIAGFCRGKKEGNGLNCFDHKGNILYKYDHSSLYIDSCDSLNVYSDNEIFLNIYCGGVESWFALSKINNKKAEKIAEWREHAKFIAFSDNMIFLEKTNGICDDICSKFLFTDIKNYNSDDTIYEFFNGNNERLHCVHAQKHYLFFWKNNSLYKFDIRQLLEKGK